MSFYKNILLCCTLLGAMTVMAEPAENLRTLQGDAFKTYIVNYALNHLSHQDDETLEINVLPLEKQIILPACTTAIDISMTSQLVAKQANSVTLSCRESPQWNIFVPINIKVFTDVLIANRLIKMGELLSASDTTYEKQDKNNLPDGFFKDQGEINGLAAKHNISAGSIITGKNTKQLPIIKKNESVSLLIKTGGVEVQMIGIAKSDGYLNDTIKILNPSSKKVIDAIVKNNHLAEINY